LTVKAVSPITTPTSATASSLGDDLGDRNIDPWPMSIF
jgi:hypothetical protein